MRRWRTRGLMVVTAFVALVAVAACSKSRHGDDDDDASGEGGSGGSGAARGGMAGTSPGGAPGGLDAGGGRGATASGGVTGGLGGALGGGRDGGSANQGGDSGAAGSGAAPGCEQLSVTLSPQVPTVELVVDTSSSMFESTPTAWSLLYPALMDADTGVVAALENKVQFGFASYKGYQGTSETDPACATMTTVPPALDNRDLIDATYAGVGATYTVGLRWETPTDYAIWYATEILTHYSSSLPGKKYILLVTDGNPNTCQVVDPQCGQDYAIRAAQDANEAGVGLFVLGIGDVVQDPDSGCPTSMRCGELHLQDLANAGVGAPVRPPPGCDDPTALGCTARYEACNQGSVLTASYEPDAPNVGVPFTVNTSTADAASALTAALNALLGGAVSCTFSLDTDVTADPSRGLVRVGGSPVGFGEPDGWNLEANGHDVTLQGAACAAYKAGGNVSIDFPCDP